MLKQIFKALPVLLLSVALFSCSDEAESTTQDGGSSSDSSISFNPSSISAEPGDAITVAATITDADGLASVTVACSDFSIDETITISDAATSYSLSYPITVPSDIFETQISTISVTAIDVDGNKISGSLLVNISIPIVSDSINPELSSLPASGTTYDVSNDNTITHTVSFTATDDTGLMKVYVAIDELNYSKTEALSGQTSYDFSETLTIPDASMVYTVEITVTDYSGNTDFYTYDFTVRYNPDFSSIYVMEGKDVSTLTSDIIGIPMMFERVSERLYEARYYSKTANTEIYFLNTKESADEYFYGVDPSDSSKIIDDYDTALPFTLPLANTYYKVTLDVLNMSYTMESYDPNDTDTPVDYSSQIHKWEDTNSTMIDLEPALIGSGIGLTDFNPKYPYYLSQDQDNKFLLYTEMELSETTGDADVRFSIFPYHDNGWWKEPNWKWNSASNPEYMVLNTGTDIGSDYQLKVPATGKYRFEFDTHTLRCKFYPID